MELKLGDIVKVRFVERVGAKMREIWRPAQIIQLAGERFGVRFQDDKQMLLEKQRYGELWR